MMHVNFRTRLTLWHALCVAAILGAAAFGSSWALARLVREQIDGALLVLAQREIDLIRKGPVEPLRIHEAPARTARPSFERLDKFVQIASLDGGVVARSATLGTTQLPLSEAAIERLRTGQIVYETVEEFGEEPIRLVSVPLVLGAAHYAVQVATSLDDARAVLRASRWLLLTIAGAILMAVAVTGSLLARRALVPIEHIVRQARQIGESRLAERLPHPGTQDEIGRLVETLNEMLARIEHGFEVQRHFTADASHELMSPLSRLRAELEVALRRPRDAMEYEDTLRSCLEEVDRLSWLTDELLGLARLDAGEGSGNAAEPVSVISVVQRVIRRLEGEAIRRHVTIVVDPGQEVVVNASTGVVDVVFSNLLDNAVKFCDVGGRVTVRIVTEGPHAVVSVSDTGPGILPAEMPLIFERFHRGSAPRATGTPGVGLGLAICRALVERQGGQIYVTARPESGATFVVRLPLAAAMSRAGGE
jgi:two-component system, OmpR family, sensor kinase